MSEPAAKVRQPIDLEEFERRLRVGAHVTKPEHDPLAELARLVGEDDPFRGIQADGPAETAAVARRGQISVAAARGPASRLHQVHPPLLRGEAVSRRSVVPPQHRDAFAPVEGHESLPDDAEEMSAQEYAAQALALRGAIVEGVTHERPPMTGPARSVYEQADHSETDEALAEFRGEGVLPPVHVMAEEPPPRRSLRGVILLLGILGAGAVGLGAALGLKGQVVALTGSKPPPVILAGGPTKVAAENNSADAGAQSSVLDKGTSVKPGPAKVVTNEEQPIDLATQPKAPTIAAAPSAPAAAMPPVGNASAPPTPARAPVVVAGNANSSGATGMLPALAAGLIGATAPAPSSAAPLALAPAGPSLASAPTANLPAVANAPASGQPQATAANGYPEPKRVKVVSVRPDGSIIDSGSAPPSASGSAAPLLPSAAAAPPPAADAAPKAASAAPKAISAKNTDRAPAAAPPAAQAADAVNAGDVAPEAASVPLPRPRPAQIDGKTPNKQKPVEVADAADAANTGDAAPAAIPAIKPSRPAAAAVRTPAKPKAAQVADAGDTDATATGSTGAFAVQLAASPNEQDAKSTMTRLSAKYANDLGGHKTTYHRVKVGDKTVYRVRVGNLSKDEASALCTKLQSNGGTCFVATQN